MVVVEGGVHLVVGLQQLLDQFLFTQSGDHRDDPLLHFLTNCVQLLMTQPNKMCGRGFGRGRRGGSGTDVTQKCRTAADQLKEANSSSAPKERRNRNISVELVLFYLQQFHVGLFNRDRVQLSHQVRHGGQVTADHTQLCLQLLDLETSEAFAP